MGGATSSHAQDQGRDQAPDNGGRPLSARQQEMVHSLMRDGLQPDVAFAHHQMPRLPPPGSQPDQEHKTVRLKNDLNVKRSSVSLVQHGMSVAVKCSVDAMVPCVLRVYFLATEVVNERNATVRYETKAGGPVTTCRLPAGLNQDFEQTVEEALDISTEEKDRLYTRPEPSTRYFPVVITVDKDDTAPQHADLENKEDLSGVRHVFSQSTYATLVLRADSTVQIKVSKQKIHIDGFSYELQEIYGLDGASSSAIADSKSTGAGGTGQVELTRGQDCVICLTDPRDTTILPCRHMCVCYACAQILRQQTNKCPICRCHVESLLKLAVTSPRSSSASAETPSATADQRDL